LNISQKTLQDLEFNAVLAHISDRCNTTLGKELALEITPKLQLEIVAKSLGETNEYLASFTSDNRVPNHGFESILEELKLLKIDNTTLELNGFKKIVVICESINAHKKFFEKFKEYYPILYENTFRLVIRKKFPSAPIKYLTNLEKLETPLLTT